MLRSSDVNKSRRVRDRPIQPGTPLFRLIEAIAREVAKRSRTEQTRGAGIRRTDHSRQSRDDNPADRRL